MLIKTSLADAEQEREKQKRDDCINRMCELMLETPAVIRMLETDNVGDGRMRGLIEGFHIDLDGRVTEMTKQLLSACMYTAKVTCSKGSQQRCFVQDLAAALNRRKLLSNEHVNDFMEEGYRYLGT